MDNYFFLNLCNRFDKFGDVYFTSLGDWGFTMKTYEITISLRTYQKAYFKANNKQEALKKADNCIDWNEIGDSNQVYTENIKLIEGE